MKTFVCRIRNVNLNPNENQFLSHRLFIRILRFEKVLASTNSSWYSETWPLKKLSKKMNNDLQPEVSSYMDRKWRTQISSIMSKKGNRTKKLQMTLSHCIQEKKRTKFKSYFIRMNRRRKMEPENEVNIQKPSSHLSTLNAKSGFLLAPSYCGLY